MHQIVADPWITKRVNLPAEPEVNLSDKEIASEVKTRLALKASTDRIIAHVHKNGFGTTGGCFNIVKMDMIKKSKTKTSLVQSELVASPEIRSQSSPTISGWKRSVQALTKSGKFTLPRLKRISSPKKEVLGDITNLDNKKEPIIKANLDVVEKAKKEPIIKANLAETDVVEKARKGQKKKQNSLFTPRKSIR